MKHEHSSSTAASAPASEGPDVADVVRRRLLKGGAAASPVLLTLVSNPVGATGTANCTIASSFVSVATFKSRNPGMTVSCGYKNVEWWKAEFAATPNSISKRRVSECFGANANCATYGNTRCGDLLAHSSGIQLSGEVGVLQHLIALANNCDTNNLSPANPAFNKAYVQSVFHSYYNNGRQYKVPGTGELWSDVKVIAWLRVMLQYGIL